MEVAILNHDHLTLHLLHAVADDGFALLARVVQPFRLLYVFAGTPSCPCQRLSSAAKVARGCGRRAFSVSTVTAGGSINLRAKCMPCEAARAKQHYERNKQRLSQSAKGPALAMPTEQTCRQRNQLLPIAAYPVHYGANSGFHTVAASPYGRGSGNSAGYPIISIKYPTGERISCMS
jgi:hypothetical protein